MEWNEWEKTHWKTVHDKGVQPALGVGDWIMFKNPDAHRFQGAPEYLIGVIYRQIGENWHIQVGDYTHKLRHQHRDRAILLPTMKSPAPPPPYPGL